MLSSVAGFLFFVYEKGSTMTQRNAKQAYIIAVTLYGTIGLILHYINAASEFVVLCRGIIGSLTILGIRYLRGGKPDMDAIRKNARILLLSGACLGLNWVFLFAAYRVTSVAVASLCNYTAPMIAVVLTAVFTKTCPRPARILCIAASIVGVVLVSGVCESDLSSVNLPGILLGLAAAAGFVGIIFLNRKLTDITAEDRSIVQLLASAAVVLPYVLLHTTAETLPHDGLSIGLIAVLGVVQTGIAYILYFGSMSVISVNSLAILGYIEPVMCVLTSALILKEGISVFGIVGAVLIIGASVVNELLPEAA